MVLTAQTVQTECIPNGGDCTNDLGNGCYGSAYSSKGSVTRFTFSCFPDLEIFKNYGNQLYDVVTTVAKTKNSKNSKNLGIHGKAEYF
ncbi:hypothetical protein [Parasitella parasitica]|uniref:Uncharacterized protein n=1 Tax=Parasitella parasitica TaxID=35722 RepID=A0A0B7N5Y5_9FUNG|nr:hypothetical protein [Parasitella parasitica]